mmetsp:Transcript_96448/g.210906  ORF Transcript_96448/g.210906 Transcript_96448/m.210906 type:complete len:205 (-) Transcript_96448:1237-1851(-)
MLHEPAAVRRGTADVDRRRWASIVEVQVVFRDITAEEEESDEVLPADPLQAKQHTAAVADGGGQGIGPRSHCFRVVVLRELHTAHSQRDEEALQEADLEPVADAFLFRGPSEGDVREDCLVYHDHIVLHVGGEGRNHGRPIAKLSFTEDRRPDLVPSSPVRWLPLASHVAELVGYTLRDVKLQRGLEGVLRHPSKMTHIVEDVV